MQSNKFTNILLGVIGLLLAIIAFFLYTQSQSKVKVNVNSINENTPLLQEGANQDNLHSKEDAQTHTQPQIQGAVTLDLSTNTAQMYKTLLTAALKEPANFNGRYRIVGIGCGTGCMNAVMVDIATGKVFDNLPFQAYSDYPFPKSVEYSVNSNIISEYKMGFNEQKTLLKTYEFDPKLGWLFD